MKHGEQWLSWASELQSLAQAGLYYGKDKFDLERYARIREIAAELRYPADEREVTLLTKVYVGALAGMMEDWLLGEIQESPEALIQFVDQLLKDHVRGAALRLTGEGLNSKLPGG